MSLPANWTAGNQFTAANENAVETAVNASTTTLAAASSTPTASVLAQFDTNKNLNASQFLTGQGTIVSAAGTTSLTVASAGTQIVTGSSTQIVALPTTSVLPGYRYIIVNQSTGAVTVTASGGATVGVLPASTSGIYTAALATPTTALGWNTLNSGAIPAANLPSGIVNFNVAQQSQACVTATPYYIAGSQLVLPATMLTGLVANKSTFIWDIAMNKDQPSTGNTFQIILFRGTAGTTADAQDVLQTISGAGTTSVADQMTLEIQLTVTVIGGTGSYYWSIIPTHLATTATGFGIVTGAAGHFSGTATSKALNTASLIFGVGFMSTTGTQPTITVPQVQASSFNVV